MFLTVRVLKDSRLNLHTGVLDQRGTDPNRLVA